MFSPLSLFLLSSHSVPAFLKHPPKGGRLMLLSQHISRRGWASCSGPQSAYPQTLFFKHFTFCYPRSCTFLWGCKDLAACHHFFVYQLKKKAVEKLLTGDARRRICQVCFGHYNKFSKSLFVLTSPKDCLQKQFSFFFLTFPRKDKVLLFIFTEELPHGTQKILKRIKYVFFSYKGLPGSLISDVLAFE